MQNRIWGEAHCRGMIVAGVVVTILTGTARAQDSSIPQTSAAPTSTGLFSSGPAAAVPAAGHSQSSPEPETNNPCATYADYQTRTGAASMPTPFCETLFPNLFGVRKFLGDNGWGAIATVQPSYSYDLNGNNRHPQNYTSQDPTYNHTTTVDLTYDLDRLHLLPGHSQLTLEGTWATTSYAGGNPNELSMTIAAIDERLADNHVELVYGYYPLIRQYYGVVLGGNASAAALGPTSVVPVQTGLSFFEPTPNVDIILRSPSKAFYDNFGFGRSVSPQPGGIFNDLKQNPSGLNFHVSNAKMVVANEVGYKVAPSANQRSIWLRAGYIYNFSDFPEWNGGTADNNWGAYVAGTIQIWRPGPGPRGLYFDAKGDLAPGKQNLYAGDYQATFFDIGPFPSRPQDMVALGYTKSYFSHDAQLLARAQGTRTASHSTATSLSYAFKVRSGLYWVNGLTYQRAPAFSPASKDAVILQEGLNFAL